MQLLFIGSAQSSTDQRRQNWPFDVASYADQGTSRPGVDHVGCGKGRQTQNARCQPQLIIRTRVASQDRARSHASACRLQAENVPCELQPIAPRALLAIGRYYLTVQGLCNSLSFSPFA